MNKPSLLYASPFPPMESGISDYSVVLVKTLAEYFDITLYTDDYEITEDSLKKFPVLRHRRGKDDLSAFDYILYNMGNNVDFHGYIYETLLEHPGTVILHDMVLYHFVRGLYKRLKNEYYTALYERFGLDQFLAVKEAIKEGRSSDMSFASAHPMNMELLRSGCRIVVHSRYAEERILKTGLIGEKDLCRINMIAQVEENEEQIPRDLLYSRYRIPQDAKVICSFGYIMQTKHNLEVCRAVKKLAKKTGRKLCYVMVGQGEYADPEVDGKTVIKTGFTELAEFNSFIRHADLIVNLRYPSLGETSAAMLRILQLGKPCITNNGGWFSEIPDDVVKKVEISHLERNLEKALEELLLAPEKAGQLGARAAKYIEDEYSGKTIASKLYEFITGGQS